MNNDKAAMAELKKKDPFRFDSEEEDAAPGTYAQIAKGDRITITDNGAVLNITEQDIPTILLPGIIPGATSLDKSEDPNFRPIWDPHRPPLEAILTDENIRQIQNASVRRYLIDPQYSGILDVFAFFIIGKGFTVSPEDESDEVEDYLEQFYAVNKFDGRDRDIIVKSLKAGEVFIRFFTKNNGVAAKIPVVRFLNYWEITKINRDPKDGETILSYERSYRTDDTTTIQKENIPADEIIHIKFGALDDHRGLPPFSCIIKRCVEYEDWVFNRIVLNRMKTCYYLEEIVDSTPAGVSEQDTMTPSAIKVGMRGKVIKRMPKPGSKLTHNKAVEYKWLSPEVQSDDAKEDGRVIRLSICSGAQVPEFVLGDSSQANYASSVTAQNPFIRKIEWFRDFYENFFQAIFTWAIAYGIRTKALPAMSQETVMKEKASNVTMMRRLKKIFKFKEQFDAAGNIVVKNAVPTKTGVDFQWPTLIATDILKDTQAYQLHQSMEIASKETISSRLGYDFEDEQRRIKHENQSSPDQGPTDNQFDQTRDEEINADDNITPAAGGEED